ncbi:MAG: hypothetical protein Q7T74_07410, partial [Candidatus Saccharibacteria bacterium]|nr:hypothetical protein [Candidatus Saccharibacteria bacterium]
DQTVLVFPDDNGCLWIIDLAVGGNGASSLLFEKHPVLIQMLRAGGQMLLDCPCEGGLASASTANTSYLQDTGCPRCMRVAGDVIVVDLDIRQDLYGQVSKQQTLQWLLSNKHLPGSGEIHIQEKYKGIDDAHRITGDDDASRKGCIKLVRRILRDRLGLEINDCHVASFGWKSEADKTLGTYESATNMISLVRGLREWFTLDVLAHELFHNYQWRCDQVFNHRILGESGEAKPPFNGKLFVEGSASWAESHIVDALAIRSSLTTANLREGDEYAAGFQLFKYIEENCGGVAAVLGFLASGDIASITRGNVTDLEHLYSAAGIRDKLA